MSSAVSPRFIPLNKIWKTSITQLTVSELEDFVRQLKSDGAKFTKSKAPARAGKRALVDGPEFTKMRALWISLYHLAVVRNPSEQALVDYAKRVSGGRNKGKEAMQWLTPSEKRNVIEALKAMAVRDADVCWDGFDFIDKPQEFRPCERVIRAQWAIMLEMKVVFNFFGLPGYAASVVQTDPNNSIRNMTDAQRNKILEVLGARIRNAVKNSGFKDYPSWKAAQNG